MKADTADAFAAAFNLPAESFKRTLDEYNRFARGEAKDPLNRAQFVKPLDFPLWGAHITGALAHTQGGVQRRRRAGACCEATTNLFPACSPPAGPSSGFPVTAPPAIPRATGWPKPSRSG